MKTLKFSSVLLVVALVLCQMSSKAEQVRKIHKSWPIDKVKSLSIENKFGNITFLNTREDSVTIDVVVDTEKDGYRNGNNLANLIDFSFSFVDGGINAQTIFNSKFKTNNDFTINYTINVPVNKRLDVKNKFGNVTLSDLKANGKFEISYGNIFGNSLLAAPGGLIELELKYSNATFETINRFKTQISYSKFRAISIENSEMETRYSTIALNNCNTLISNSQYDNFTIGNLQIMKTDSKFTDWKISEIVSDADFTTDYGDVNVDHVSKKFQNIKIDNRYGNIRIGIDKEASYNLSGDTYYCEVKYPKTSPAKYFKDNNHTIIEAVIGSGNPSSKVIIESKYGNIDLNK